MHAPMRKRETSRRIAAVSGQHEIVGMLRVKRNLLFD
jgi:hypothetical protein